MANLKYHTIGIHGGSLDPFVHFVRTVSHIPGSHISQKVTFPREVTFSGKYDFPGNHTSQGSHRVSVAGAFKLESLNSNGPNQYL